MQIWCKRTFLKTPRRKRLKLKYFWSYGSTPFLIAAIDCEWHPWSFWEECSRTCGGGERQKTRSVRVQEQHGGAVCSGNNTEKESCNNHPCRKFQYSPTYPKARSFSITLESCKLAIFTFWCQMKALVMPDLLWKAHGQKPSLSTGNLSLNLP